MYGAVRSAVHLNLPALEYLALHYCSALMCHALQNEEKQRKKTRKPAAGLSPGEHELWLLARLLGAYSTRDTQNARKLPGTLHQSSKAGCWQRLEGW